MSKNQIQPEELSAKNEQVDAGRGARMNPSRETIHTQAGTGTGKHNVHFPCSADLEQDRQPYPVDPYSAIYVMTKEGVCLMDS